MVKRQFKSTKKNIKIDYSIPGQFVLKNISVKELRNEDAEIEFKNLSIGDFNLLIGDNAQGKTRLFNVLNFISSLFIGKPRIITTHFLANMKFQYKIDNNDWDVNYILEMKPQNGKNIFEEEVKLDKKVIYSSKKKILFNENKQEEIKNFYIPNNIPAVMSITEYDFVTLNTIREFFQKIVYISSNKTKDFHFDDRAVVPNEIGTNISSVLHNWNKNTPELFNEVINEFKRCFSFIKEVDFAQKHPLRDLAHMIQFKEKGVKKPILQGNWSAGMYRLLHLIMTTKIPFEPSILSSAPSLILIDEIENGLDFKTLKYIIKYLQDYSDESQVIITSHSPLVCDFISPKNWIVVKREGSTLKFTNPTSVEPDLFKQMEIFKQNHWDFYTKHISNSSLYRVRGNE